MKRTEPFETILEDLQRPGATAEDVVEAISRLRRTPYAGHVAAHLLCRFGEDPKITRVLIRAAGKSRSPELHDVLADRLMDPSTEDFRYELIDALAETGSRDYAAVVIPFASADHPDEVRTTAIYALGALRSPVSILPLIKNFQKSRNRRLRGLVIESLSRILDSPRKRKSLDVYLATASERTRNEIREALANAA